MPWKDAQQHEQDRRQDAYRVVAGKDTDEESGMPMIRIVVTSMVLRPILSP